MRECQGFVYTNTLQITGKMEGRDEGVGWGVAAEILVHYPVVEYVLINTQLCLQTLLI